MLGFQSGLMGRSAKPLFGGSNPSPSSIIITIDRVKRGSTPPWGEFPGSW